MKKSCKLLWFVAGAALGAGIVAKCMKKQCCPDCVDSWEEEDTASDSEEPKQDTRRHYVSIPVSMEKIKEEVGTAIDSVKAKMDKMKKAAEEKAEELEDAAEELLEKVEDSIETKAETLEENIEEKFEEVMSDPSEDEDEDENA